VWSVHNLLNVESLFKKPRSHGFSFFRFELSILIDIKFATCFFSPTAPTFLMLTHLSVRFGVFGFIERAVAIRIESGDSFGGKPLGPAT